MVQRPSQYEWEQSPAVPLARQAMFPLKSVCPEGLPSKDERSTRTEDADLELPALNALIHDRGARWSKQARAIKFEIEFNAIEQERRRVAKDLHDEILPLLARLIRSIESQGTSDSGRLISALHATVAAIRDILGELHPVDLEELGLAPALSNLCKRYARLTQRCVAFIEQSEECALTELQQLCLYRAVQNAFKLFGESENDILLLGYNRFDERGVITLRCVDKRVSSAEWLSDDKYEFNVIESWCAMAGAEMIRNALDWSGYPCDMVFSVSEREMPEENFVERIGQITKVRLQELDSIVAFAQEEWANLINRDCALYRTLAVETERRRILEAINKIVIPQLNSVHELASQSVSACLKRDISRRMNEIVSAFDAVLVELRPKQLDEAGLIPSMKTLISRFKRASMIDASLISNVAPNQIDIPLDAKFALYRVTQEALNNIEKHASASRAIVTIIQDEQKLSICIEDNGVGFQEPKSTLSRGLRNIRQRAADIGATVFWEKASSFETGTLVTIALPH